MDELDFEFMTKDLSKLIDSMQIGTERIWQIVLSLHNFARLGEAALKQVNIHKRLDNTLLILGNRLKESFNQPEIHLVKEYANSPLVECYTGQLNQAFIDLLNNAIDALREFTQAMLLINIRTFMRDTDWVCISISDNGSGIPKRDLQQIFDPFFTTKSLGKGTGLGLTITYQIIVEKHHGHIEVHFQPGKGTDFVLTLPARGI